MMCVVSAWCRHAVDLSGVSGAGRARGFDACQRLPVSLLLRSWFYSRFQISLYLTLFESLLIASFRRGPVNERDGVRYGRMRSTRQRFVP